MSLYPDNMNESYIRNIFGMLDYFTIASEIITINLSDNFYKNAFPRYSPHLSARHSYEYGRGLLNLLNLALNCCYRTWRPCLRIRRKVLVLKIKLNDALLLEGKLGVTLIR